MLSPANLTVNLNVKLNGNDYKNFTNVGESFEFSDKYDQKFTDEVSDECTKIIADKMATLQQELAVLVENEQNKKKKSK